jgi:hypothetical protein
MALQVVGQFVADAPIILGREDMDAIEDARIANDPLEHFRPTLRGELPADLRGTSVLASLTDLWARHEIGFGIGIAHGYATLEAVSGANYSIHLVGPHH